MMRRRGFVRLALAGVALWVGVVALGTGVVSAVPYYFSSDDDPGIYLGSVPEDKAEACFAERYKKNLDTMVCFVPSLFPRPLMTRTEAASVISGFLLAGFGPLVGIALLLVAAAWIKKGFEEPAD